jgi:hypothetical protein
MLDAPEDYIMKQGMEIIGTYFAASNKKVEK